MLSTDRSVSSPGSDATAEPEVRERILNAARLRFADQSYAGTSVREIATDAGVTKPMVYYYFGSKEGLFRALIDDVYERARQRMELSRLNEGSPRERLLRLARGHVEFMHSHGGTVRLLMQSMAPTQPRRAPAIDVERFHVMYLDAVRMALRGEEDGPQPDPAAVELFATVFHGAMSTMQCDPSGPIDSDLPEKIIDLIWTGAERLLGRKDAA